VRFVYDSWFWGNLSIGEEIQGFVGSHSLVLNRSAIGVTFGLGCCVVGLSVRLVGILIQLS